VAQADSDRSYHMLEEIGVQPNVNYLVKVRNTEEAAAPITPKPNDKDPMHSEAAIREPLILGHKTYHDITHDIVGPIENKAPRGPGTSSSP
jgi:hypothetical protein